MRVLLRVVAPVISRIVAFIIAVGAWATLSLLLRARTPILSMLIAALAAVTAVMVAASTGSAFVGMTAIGAAFT